MPSDPYGPLFPRKVRLVVLGASAPFIGAAGSSGVFRLCELLSGHRFDTSTIATASLFWAGVIGFAGVMLAAVQWDGR